LRARYPHLHLLSLSRRSLTTHRVQEKEQAKALLREIYSTQAHAEMSLNQSLDDLQDVEDDEDDVEGQS
jgi:hypothetical protein